MCSATSARKYLHQVSSVNGPTKPNNNNNNNNMFVGNNNNGFANGYMMPSTKQTHISMQTVVLTFSILLCIFSCLLTVTLSYKWHMDTNRQIDRLVGTVEEIVHDLNTFTDIVREELVAKRVNVYKDRKNKIIDGSSYDEDVVEDDYSEDKFMGRELFDNNWPSKNNNPAAADETQTPNYRKKRSAEIGESNIAKNELKK